MSAPDMALPRRATAILLALTLAVPACGGGVETTERVSKRETPSPGALPGSTPPSEAAPSRPPSTGPSPSPTPSLPPPSKVADPPAAGDTPFHLVVKNTSTRAGTMSIDVDIDGTRVVTGGFAPSVSYEFGFALEPGTHTVRLRVAATNVSTPADETLPFVLSAERWGVAEVGTVRCDPCSNAYVRWDLRDTSP